MDDLGGIIESSFRILHLFLKCRLIGNPVDAILKNVSYISQLFQFLFNALEFFLLGFSYLIGENSDVSMFLLLYLQFLFCYRILIEDFSTNLSIDIRSSYLFKDLGFSILVTLEELGEFSLSEHSSATELIEIKSNYTMDNIFDLLV